MTTISAIRGRLIQFIALAICLTFTTSCSVGGAQESPLTIQEPGPPDNPPPTNGNQLMDIGGCEIPCEITGSVKFDHPTWGPSTLLTAEASSGGGLTIAYIAVVGFNGALTWSRESTVYSVAPADTPTDSTGHVFLTYNPRRYDGVIVLSPVENGFNFFESLPAEDDYLGRFYNAAVADTDDDGVLEIEKSTNDCT